VSALASADAVLAFWFSAATEPFWFRATPAFDAALRQRFATTYRAAVAGRLAGWEQSPAGALALVITLDQWPLNMFRGRPEGFATEAEARRVAAAAIAQGFDSGLTVARRAFLYLPFMHSEDLVDQDRSVALFSADGFADNLEWARHHRELIRRFGRFPHRNAILGRPNTPEEAAYLGSEAAFRG
jgi:uncharacterized protein (DUF924 family)